MVLIPSRAFLCGVCTFFLCLHVFLTVSICQICDNVNRWMQIGTLWFLSWLRFPSYRLTIFFSFAFLLGQPGLQLSLIGSETVVHLLLLLQLLAQLRHSTVQLCAPKNTPQKSQSSSVSLHIYTTGLRNVQLGYVREPVSFPQCNILLQMLRLVQTGKRKSF